MMESNYSGVVNGLEYYDVSFLPNSIPDLGFGVPSSSDFYLRMDHQYHHQPSIWVPDQDHHFSPPADEIDSENTLLKYVNQLLMEESLTEKQSMFYDSLALRQTEEMLQQVISDSQTHSFIPNSISTTSTSSNSGDYRSSSNSSNSSVRIETAANSAENEVLLYDNHLGDSGVVSFPGSNMLRGGGQFGQPANEILVRSMFSDAESAMQFKRGLEEASKFLPNTDQWIFNLEPEMERVVPVKQEKGWSGVSRTRKNHREREEEDYLEEARSSKQFAVNEEDGKLTEMFDKVLLLDGEYDPLIIEDGENGSSKAQVKKGRGKKKSRAVDFRTLLTLCAQSVSAGDKITADDLLRQIRKQCSPVGDASQRLAHFFANALEARLEGSTGTTIQSYYDSISSKKRTAAQILKSYSVFLSASPFMTLIYFFSNKMIFDAAEGASVLHIIDFGILYGFQWPMFIQHLSKIKTGLRKLRITGIEIPQHGLRPTERIQDTGRRLTEYCKRFGIPFEYNAIASKNWETIRMEEFKIRPNEVLAVNAALRFKNLRDVIPGEEDCPRDAFLKLIRDMNPNVFLSSTINGSFNAPFFTTRFKEALFHYSALFDLFGATLSKENPERIHFEGEFYGREVMNVIACEGVDRVERPETYKQWQVRMIRAGFKQKPVEAELVQLFREKMKKWGYHKDFVLDEDSNWFLQGWKGRILFSSSCWVPS
ncbi:Transcription factor GRAS [Arabidopsis thaliana x Arabidopsis arenosa]|uniref:Transcription factor GRAS n=1 Tax=Arabidopsis thaliana x Arabidopsis arenosa TaxID=1240361 RepID=A0A8T2BU19_9BRAS|nr:Transcription factor GRAS [Arabidopsis thaliana x Arabidopsis arenosa]